jgi:hypothetical protein
MQLFRVYLPDSLGAGCISVAYQSKLTLGEVMDTVCKKRAFNPHDFQFDYSAGFAPPGQSAPKLNLSMTLGELGVPRLDLLESELSRFFVVINIKLPSFLFDRKKHWQKQGQGTQEHQEFHRQGGIPATTSARSNVGDR